VSSFSSTWLLTQYDAEKPVKKLFGGGKDAEAVLQRLDRLTQDESRTTAAEILKIVYGLVQCILLASRWLLNILPSRWQGI